MFRFLPVLGSAVIVLGMFSTLARASETVARFDPAQGEFPEGIAFDAAGHMYVSIAPLGQVRRLEGDGTWTLVHQFPPGSGGLAVLGLAADRRGTVYVAVPSTDPSAHGVWALDSQGGARRLPGSEAILFPNGIALDEHGTLYVTDSVRGAVWRIRPGSSAELWLEDETLTGTGLLNGPELPIGANGIAYLRGRLLVANSERKQLVAIPIDNFGDPQSPTVVHVFPGQLDLLDGVAVDVVGNAYLVVGGNRLVRLSPSGDVTLVANHDEDGLTVPASLAFGTNATGNRTLFLTNLSLPPLVALVFGSDEPLAPGVVAVEVPLPGPPLAP
jgi:sugar lactone lactonase YvrE